MKTVQKEFGDACRNGDMKLVLSCIEKGANDWNEGMSSACFGGHLAIINLMIEKGADDWDYGMSSAGQKGMRVNTDNWKL